MTFPSSTHSQALLLIQAHSNMSGFVGDEPIAKKIKGSKKEPVIPSSVIVNIINKDGERAGPAVDLPVTADPSQLQSLTNSLLSNESALPYAFYINDYEVTSSLLETITEIRESNKDMSFEDTLTINYQPLSVFRVRPVTRCVETMPGHTDAVIHLSYSPDGKKLASGGGDMAVRFWNVITSMPQYTCTGHRHHVLCTGWTPNGKTFVSADRSGEIRMWDPATGKQQGQPMRGHKKWVTSLAFEPLHMDGRCVRFASSSKDYTIKVWNMMNGTCETTISGHLDSVECVKWGGTGLLYTCSRDRTIKVWAIDGHGRNQQLLVRTLSGHAHRINSLALNCDYLLRTGCCELAKKAPTDPDEAKALALERYEALVGITGSEERLVSCSDDFTMFMWAPQVTLRLYSVPNTYILPIFCLKPPLLCNLSPGPKFPFPSHFYLKSSTPIPQEGKAPITRMIGHQQAVNHIAFSPDARYVASASFDKKVKLWCGKKGTFIATLTGHVGSVYQV